jgi:CheY-like chemotaxis protein
MVSPSEPKPAAPTVLVVDDIPHVVSLYSAILHAAGFNIFEAFSGLQAIEIVRATRPDAVVSGVIMPNGDGSPAMDGFDAAQQILRLYPALPFLFVTGSYPFTKDTDRQEKIRRLREKNYIFDVWGKPCNPEHLADKIGQMTCPKK